MRLTDVRVERAALSANGWAAMWTLIEDPTVFNINWEPPASGPEAEVTFCNLEECDIRLACTELGLSILALRVREVGHHSGT